MKTKKLSAGIPMIVGSGDVFADLGFKNADAMLVKARLVSKISQIIKSKGYTQAKAAAMLKLTQPKLSGMLRGHFHGFSERKLMDCLTLLGQDVQIVVSHAPRARPRGTVSVLIA
jgi:predicted XRE-type DNA-binding protein